MRSHPQDTARPDWQGGHELAVEAAPWQGTLIVARGELDIASVTSLREKLDEAAGSTRILLDFAKSRSSTRCRWRRSSPPSAGSTPTAGWPSLRTTRTCCSSSRPAGSTPSSRCSARGPRRKPGFWPDRRARPRHPQPHRLRPRGDAGGGRPRSVQVGGRGAAPGPGEEGRGEQGAGERPRRRPGRRRGGRRYAAGDAARRGGRRTRDHRGHRRRGRRHHHHATPTPAAAPAAKKPATPAKTTAKTRSAPSDAESSHALTLARGRPPPRRHGQALRHRARSGPPQRPGQPDRDAQGQADHERRLRGAGGCSPSRRPRRRTPASTAPSSRSSGSSPHGCSSPSAASRPPA